MVSDTELRTLMGILDKLSKQGGRGNQDLTYRVSELKYTLVSEFGNLIWKDDEKFPETTTDAGNHYKDPTIEKIDVPDLLIEVFASPMRLCLTSKSEPIEVVTVEVLEDILGTNEIPYVIKGRHYGKETIPYELEVVFNRLYSGVMLNQLAKALQGIMIDKGFKVVFR